MERFSPTELIGVKKVEEIFLREFNWIPRIQYVADYGIDMIVEITNNSNPTGKLIAVQIKSGVSYFQRKQKHKIAYYSDKTHIDYWLNHSLPVIIVLHNDQTNKTYWQVINKSTAFKTGKKIKILIPKSNLLNKGALEKLTKLHEYSKPIQKFIEFSIYKPLMQKIYNGNEIVLEMEEWGNKMNGQAELKIIEVINEDEEKENGNEDNTRKEIVISQNLFYGIVSYITLFKIFPWADFKLDRQFYEEFDDFEEMPNYKIVFMEEKYSNYELPIIPYSQDGEVDRYRFIMSLNEIGQSFLNLYNGFENGLQLKLF